MKCKSNFYKIHVSFSTRYISIISIDTDGLLRKMEEGPSSNLISLISVIVRWSLPDKQTDTDRHGYLYAYRDDVAEMLIINENLPKRTNYQ